MEAANETAITARSNLRIWTSEVLIAAIVPCSLGDTRRTARAMKNRQWMNYSIAGE
jgi:hypothetical protein